MIRFKEICLTESFKEKVNSYNIKNPYIKNFILRYENLIDWGAVKTVKKSGDDVDRNIQSQVKVLVDKFTKTKLDPESKKSLYSSENDINWDRELEILQTEIENGNIEAEQALEQFKESPKESKAQVVDKINEGKRNVFNEWMGYIKYNDQYRDNYAFQYIIIKSLLDQNGKTRNPPTPVNAAIVANLFEKIKQQPNSPFNIEKSYISFYSDYLESKNEMIKGSGGEWMKIPSEKEDSENYENNIKDLMSMSYSSWCVRQDYFARTYLARGAFWLYFVEDKKGNKYAEIAIRLVDNNIAEIRGATSDQSIPKESEPIIVDFLEKVRDSITGGQDFLNKYYRKQYDAKAKKYFKENWKQLLEYYERHMPLEYISEYSILSEDEYKDVENDKLLNWWQNGQKVDDGDSRQTKFEFDTDPQFETVDDDFRFNALLVGLIENSGIENEIGYNYVTIDKNISLEEFKEKTDDGLIGEFIYLEQNGYEGGDIYQIDYDKYVGYAKEYNEEGYNKLSNLLTDDYYDVSEFIQKHSGDLCDHSAIYGETAGQREAFESEVFEKLKSDLPDAIELDGVRIENIDDKGYWPEPSDRNYIITIQHDSLIEYLLENFEEVVYNGQIDWKEHWEDMGSVDYPSDFDESAAKKGFFEEWVGFEDYIEKAVSIYATEFVENFDGETIDVLSPDEIIEDIDGILIHNGNKYRPLGEMDGDIKGPTEAVLANELERTILVRDNETDFITDNDITLFNVNIPQMNQKWMGYYVLDNTVKTSVDPQTMKPITEAVGYLKYF